MRTLLCLFAVCAEISAAFPAEQPPTSAGFSSMIIPSVQYAAADFYFHTPPYRPPQFAMAGEIAPDQRLDLLVFVSGFRVDASGTANVTYRLTVHYPNGKTEGPTDSLAAIDRAKIDPHSLPFPVKVVSFKVDPDSPAGEYRFEIVAEDLVGGSTFTKSATVRATESAAPLPLPADLDPGRFTADYYRRPRPRLTWPVLRALSDTPIARQPGNRLGPMLGFYGQVLADNPWLLPQFEAELIHAMAPGERRLVALVLAYAERSKPDFGADLPGPAKAALTAARQEALPVPESEPLDAGALDSLWGVFLASGRFEPVSQLVGIVAAYLPYRGKLGEFKQLSPRPKVVPPEAYKDLILNAALWSLGSNGRQHPLVHDYLAGIQQSTSEPPERKLVARVALAWKPPE